MNFKNVFPIVAIVMVGLVISCSNELDTGKHAAGTILDPIKANSIMQTTNSVNPLFVDLKTSGQFGILSGAAITSTGFSTINNLSVGIYPGVRSSIIGFPPAIIVNGALYAGDDNVSTGTPAMLSQAKQDLTDAYLFVEAAVSPTTVIVAGD